MYYGNIIVRNRFRHFRMGFVMKVLVACEESQVVCTEFRKRGHEAYSCDILPCSGGHPEWHIQQDVLPLLKEKWDIIIAFPPCTYLTVTGNRWFNIDRYGEKAIQRHKDRKDAIDFFMAFAIPGNVLLLNFARSSFGKRHASAYQDGIVFPLSNLFRCGISTIFVGFNSGRPFNQSQVFSSKASPT